MAEWKALPGGVMAYGDTGFEIRLTPEHPREAYKLFDPEGRPLLGASSAGLEMLKRFAEDGAKARQQFEIPGVIQ